MSGSDKDLVDALFDKARRMLEAFVADDVVPAVAELRRRNTGFDPAPLVGAGIAELFTGFIESVADEADVIVRERARRANRRIKKSALRANTTRGAR